MTARAFVQRAVAVAMLALGLGVGSGEVWAARDAAFLDPGVTTGSVGGAAGRSGDEAVNVEPKSEIDTGESVVNVARRTTLFFANPTTQPVEVVSVATNADGNVHSDVVSDDCSKEGKIAASSRCSVVVEVTPSLPGAWSVEVLMTHKSAGRIARAKLTGKTGVQAVGDKKDNGLALSAKEAKPVEFGDIEVDGGRAVRSALMINDSFDSITLLSIDVIAAENGLERLDQGCAVDMELKPGESCPVTLVWKPKAKGIISTDLIIRHSGKLGFAVVPVRGKAHGNASAAESPKDSSSAQATAGSSAPSSGKEPPALTAAEDLERAVGNKIPPITADMLPRSVVAVPPAASSEVFHLIGTVGHRAVLLKPDGTTSVVDVGEDIPYGDGKIAKITSVLPKEADIFIKGARKVLRLERASELTSKAARLEAEAAAAAEAEAGKGDGKASRSSGAASSLNGGAR